MFNLTQEQLERNITAYYFLATKKELANGCEWYRKAYWECARLGAQYNVPVDTVICIVAALSPRNRWSRNLIDAEQILIHGENATVSTFNTNKEKAVRILNGEAPLDVLSGNKVRSFYNCVSSPSCYCVCVDSHAYAVAAGFGERIKVKSNTITDKVYQAVTQAYQAVAEQFNVLPLELQATTWLTYRRVHKITV